MVEQKTTVKVLSLQIFPAHKDIQKSMQKAEQLLDDYSEKDQIDILLLSEMVFTGYKFKDKQDIEPFLENAGEGQTFEWCSKQAKRLGCWVFCGYPEFSEKGLYNSQMVIDPQGKFVKSYAKHFLYETDETWASEGSGFDTMELKLPRQDKTILIGHGICMDINPYQFKADYEKFEFANFHKDKKCQLILFSSAWLDPNQYPNDAKATHETINYWANRLIPLITDDANKSPCYFVCSNRVGLEMGENYMGSSCILQLRPKVSIVANLSRKEQNSICATLQL